MFRGACVWRIATVGFLVAVAAPALPAQSSRGPQPDADAPLFQVVYTDRDFPNYRFKMSRHKTYAEALDALAVLAKTEGVIEPEIIPIDPKTGEEVPWPANVKKDDRSKAPPTADIAKDRMDKMRQEVAEQNKLFRENRQLQVNCGDLEKRKQKLDEQRAELIKKNREIRDLDKELQSGVTGRPLLGKCKG